MFTRAMRRRMEEESEQKSQDINHSNDRNCEREEESKTNDVQNSNDKNDGNAQEPPKKKRKISSSHQLIDLDEHLCCICRELSSQKIFQCSDGHLICEGCYGKIMDDKCPLCRITIDRTNPIRNRFAEKSLAQRIVSCDFDGCGQEMKFSQLFHHQQNECYYKLINCKFTELGCKWKGIGRDSTKHEKNCKLDQNQILQLVQQLKQENKDKLKEQERRMTRQMALYQELVANSQSINTYSFTAPYNEPFSLRRIPSFIKCGHFYVELKCELQLDFMVYYARIAFEEEREEEYDDYLGFMVYPEEFDIDDNPGALISSWQERYVAEDEFTSEWIQFDTKMAHSKYIHTFQYSDFNLKVIS